MTVSREENEKAAEADRRRKAESDRIRERLRETEVEVHSSSQWPDFVCKNNCGTRESFRFDGPEETCPGCGSPLIRWQKYEVKKKTGKASGTGFRDAVIPPSDPT